LQQNVFNQQFTKQPGSPMVAQQVVPWGMSRLQRSAVETGKIRLHPFQAPSWFFAIKWQYEDLIFFPVDGHSELAWIHLIDYGKPGERKPTGRADAFFGGHLL
jgi:hypothetical protein